MRSHLVLSLWLGLYFWTNGLAVPPAEAAARPSSTVRVPMRDGTLLATDVYLPTGNGPWPVVLVRTPFGRTSFWSSNPYNPQNEGIPPASFLTHGFALVVQDTRGTGGSQGISLFFLDEGWGEHPDGLDTVHWIRSQPWSNGKIAGYGGSSLGAPQYLLAGSGPEGIVGQHVRATQGNLYLAPYQNGVWHKELENFFRSHPAMVPLARTHPDYDDFWRGEDLSARVDQVHWPMVPGSPHSEAAASGSASA